MTSRSESGMTLVEVSMALTLLFVFTGATFLAVNRSSAAYRVEAVRARLGARAQRALDEVAQRLREADFSSITPPAVGAPSSTTRLDFQRARGFDDATGTVQWGLVERIVLEYDPLETDDDADNDGDGLVDEGRLVLVQDADLPSEQRVVLCTSVSEALEGEVLGDGGDDNGNSLADERGFCAELVGRTLVLRLTLAEADPDGHLIFETATRTVTGRNTPE